MAGSLPRRAAGVGVAVLVAAGVAALVLGGDDDDDGNSSGVSAAGIATTTTTSSQPPPDSTVDAIAAAPPTTPPTSGAVTSTRAAAPSPARQTAPTPTTVPARCPVPASGSDFHGFGAEEIVIDSSQGAHRSCVLTADTPEQRQQGLMHQDDLDRYDGMIFRFEQEQELTFWMRNTRIPLSIAFFSASGGFVSWADMEPCGDSADCPRYTSGGPAMFALEVQKGGLPAAGAIPGSRLYA